MKLSRTREREIFRQIKARNHSHTVVFRGFRNAELAEKIRSQRGLSFYTRLLGACRAVRQAVSTVGRAGASSRELGASAR